MIDIICSHCDFVFPARPFGVSQILRCPQCKECVTIPAMASSENIEPSPAISEKNPWKWCDIIIALLLPVLMSGIMYTLGLFGFLINPFMAIIWIVIVASSYTTIALWLYRKRVGTWPLKKITLKGFLIESLWSALYLSIFLFVVCLLGIILYYLFGYKDTSNWMGRYDGFKYNNVIYISILIYTFTIVPLYEELYYRGFLYNALKSRIHWIIAGICHALFFSLMHRYNFWGFITIFFAGLMLVGIYEHRKRLLTSVLLTFE